MDNYDLLVKKYSDQNVSADPERLELFRNMSPLTKGLIITTYGTFEKFMDSHSRPHPLEEYYISFDENMFEDDLICTIGRRMGIEITNKRNAYKMFIDKIVTVVQDSGFTYEEYEKYMNMTEREYDKLEIDYSYDDRLFALTYLKNRK